MSTGLTNDELCALYRQYGHLLLRRSRALLRDEQLAEDVLQNVFLKLMRCGAGVREARSQLAWLYQVVDRCSWDMLRSRRGQHVTPGSPNDELSVLPIEEGGFLARLLSKLRPSEQTVAVLLYSDGLTQLEVSKQLGRSRLTINKQAKVIRAIASQLVRDPDPDGVR